MADQGGGAVLRMRRMRQRRRAGIVATVAIDVTGADLQLLVHRGVLDRSRPVTRSAVSEAVRIALGRWLRYR